MNCEDNDIKNTKLMMLQTKQGETGRNGGEEGGRNVLGGKAEKGVPTALMRVMMIIIIIMMVMMMTTTGRVIIKLMMMMFIGSHLIIITHSETNVVGHDGHEVDH